jgi:hypothetical protein
MVDGTMLGVPTVFGNVADADVVRVVVLLMKVMIWG